MFSKSASIIDKFYLIFNLADGLFQITVVSAERKHFTTPYNRYSDGGLYSAQVIQIWSSLL